MATRPLRTGTTLTELMVVLSIIGLMAAIGLGTVKDQIPRFRMVRAAKQLASDISALRNTAIEQNRETRLLLVAADSSWESPGASNIGEWWMQVGDLPLGSSQWDTFPADAQEDGVDDSFALGQVVITEDGDDEVPGVSLKPWDPLAGPGAGNVSAIVFSPRGWLSNPPGDFNARGYIELTLVNIAAKRGGVDDLITVRIARSGMVRLVSSLGEDLGGTAGTATGSSAGGP
ncbi:MAG: GspH/FimT family pseudopilin [Deltaproteobacteria bacterium]|nr:GspH/FimT family pseudopilin [Deltaproteobacteria bacterium]